MADQRLDDKAEYFRLLDLADKDDEVIDFPDAGLLDAERALMERKPAGAAAPPPKLKRKASSFLGPTPKEQQAMYEAEARKRQALDEARANKRARTQLDTPVIPRSVSAPEIEVTGQSPVTVVKETPIRGPPSASKLRKSKTSSPTPITAPETEFYKKYDIPHGPGTGKASKGPAVIKFKPESRRYLRGKLIYFFPNDDIDTARRMRITVILALGGAWTKTWRSDVDYIMVDHAPKGSPPYTYQQLLRHLKMDALPANIPAVVYDPFVPECCHWNRLLESYWDRFQVTGAPKQKRPTYEEQPPVASNSQESMQVKPVGRKRFLESSQSDSEEDESPHKRSKEDSGASARHAKPAEDTAIDSYQDALTEAIREVKAVEHLPLDLDYDQEGSDDERASSEPVYRPPSERAKSFDQSAFQCMEAHDDNEASKSPNARTIEVLKQMAKYYEQQGDRWRPVAYRKGIAALSKEKRKICTEKEALQLKGIGKGLAEKIEEIVTTDRLRKLEATKDDPYFQALRLFQGIYGVGLGQAQEWYSQGFRTLDDLREKAHLTNSQKVGVEHYEDFNSRIRRYEVEAHGAIVRRALKKIDPDFEVIIMGSYRRGAQDSGDIDLIISKKRTPMSTMRTVVFESLIPKLMKDDFLKVGLATPRGNDGSKWLGASALPGAKVWRRIDFLLVPESEMGAALIYFTGNDIFNRSIRLLARKMGMRLNQRGLYKDVLRGKNGEKTAGTLLEGRDEKRIFELLGVPWRPPHQRIVG